MADKITDDINEHLDNLKDLKTWLGQVYYNDELVDLINKPFLSHLSAGVKHVINNLKVLKSKHIKRTQG